MTTKTTYNNRFNVLMEDENNNKSKNKSNKNNNVNNNNNNIKKEDTVKDNNNHFNSFKMDKQVIREKTFIFDKKREEQAQYELNSRRLRIEENFKKAKEQEIKNLTNMNNFPELKTTNKASRNLQNSEKVYKEKLLKNENDSCENNEIDTIISDGCVCIELDKKNNNFIWNYGSGKNVINNDDNINFDYSEEPYWVMNRLTRLFEKRRNEYINNWGVDDYENTFLFPNYDYDYRMFDYSDEN